jgi:hypothetical protein
MPKRSYLLFGALLLVVSCSSPRTTGDKILADEAFFGKEFTKAVESSKKQAIERRAPFKVAHQFLTTALPKEIQPDIVQIQRKYGKPDRVEDQLDTSSDADFTLTPQSERIISDAALFSDEFRANIRHTLNNSNKSGIISVHVPLPAARRPLLPAIKSKYGEPDRITTEKFWHTTSVVEVFSESSDAYDEEAKVHYYGNLGLCVPTGQSGQRIAYVKVMRRHSMLSIYRYGQISFAVSKDEGTNRVMQVIIVLVE